MSLRSISTEWNDSRPPHQLQKRDDVRLRSSRAVRPTSYEVDKQDPIDEHVGYYLRLHPEACVLIERKRPGVYNFDHREVKVEWYYATLPGLHGHLVVVDGPLRQPFSDYMEKSEANAEYDSRGVDKKDSALHCIPKEKRMSFQDQHKVYNRLEAMKVAKEQSIVRERQAEYVRQGKEVPDDLIMTYRKTIQQKLETGRRPRSPHKQKEAAPPDTGPSDVLDERCAHLSRDLESGSNERTRRRSEPVKKNQDPFYSAVATRSTSDLFVPLAGGTPWGKPQAPGAVKQQLQPPSQAWWHNS